MPRHPNAHLTLLRALLLGVCSLVAVPRPTAASLQREVPAMNGRIAFTSDRDGKREIYVMNADGTGQTNLSNNAAEDFGPAWSPDGTRIAFSSIRDGNWEIYVMNADGTGQTNLSKNPAHDYQPAMSPDGTKIAFKTNRDGHNEIYVMNADGTGQVNLSNNGTDNDSPAWSPDGTKIAFANGFPEQIYVMNADGTGQTNLSNNAATDSDPAWSPDGTKILFSSGESFDENFEIYVMNADGTGRTRLTNNVAALNPAWSPDGTKIAFTSSRDGHSEIYVMNADGTGLTDLSNNAATDSDPAWSGQLPLVSPHAQQPARAAQLQVASNGDGGAATHADVYPSGVAVDARGNLYISENSILDGSDDTRVRKVGVDGIITTVAGTGTRGFGGDGGPAASALLAGPVAIAADSGGTIYIVDAVGVQDCLGVRVRRVSLSGIITTVAGGPSGFRQSGETGCGIFNDRIATDPHGIVYIADDDDNRVLLLDSTGSLRVAATKVAGPIASTRRGMVIGVGNTVIVITSVGTARLVGDGSCGTRPDGAMGLCGSLNRITAIAVDRDNLVYIADSLRVYRWSGANPQLTTIAGNGNEGFSGDGGAAVNATFRSIVGIAVDGSGNLYVADAGNRRVRKVDTNGVITSIAGNRPPNPPPSDGEWGGAAAATPPAPDVSGNVPIGRTAAAPMLPIKLGHYVSTEPGEAPCNTVIGAVWRFDGTGFHILNGGVVSGFDTEYRQIERVEREQNGLYKVIWASPEHDRGDMLWFEIISPSSFAWHNQDGETLRHCAPESLSPRFRP